PKGPARASRPRVPGLSQQLRLLQGIAEGRLLVVHASNVATLRLDEAKALLDVARRLCQKAEQAARVLSAHVESIEATCANVLPAPTRARSLARFSPPSAWTSKRSLPAKH